MGVLATHRCGHIRSSTGCEVDNDVDAVTAFYGISEENGPLVERYEEPFPDDEVGAYIGAGNRFGFIGDSRSRVDPLISVVSPVERNLFVSAL